MSIGKIREFDIGSGHWDSYCERLEMYFAANGVSADKQLATLISVVGDQCYELMVNLASPKKPSQYTYKELVTLVQKQLEPKPSIMAERYRFRLRRQCAGETIAQYTAELKRLARSCEFKEALMDNLRDQFVCGVIGDVIRQRLFAESDLTYAKAVTLACSLEAAERDAAVIVECGQHQLSTGARGESAGEVHRVANGGSGGGGAGGGSAPGSRLQRERRQTGFSARTTIKGSGSATPCHACGATNHDAARCKFRRYICSMCQTMGHLRRVCPSSGASGKQQTHKDRSRANFVAKEVSDDDEGESEEEEAFYRMALNHYKPVSLPVLIDGKELIMEIDTGAVSSFISKRTFELYFAKQQVRSTTAVFKFYDGTKIKPYGVITPLVEYGTASKRLDLYIVERGETSLVGRQWLAELAVKIPVLKSSSVNRVSALPNVDTDLNLILDRNKEVFDGTLGCYNGGLAKLHIRDGAVPVFRRARPLPFALRGRVDAELDAMLRAGIIEPVQCSDWATPLVPVTKKDGGLRVCADFKVTLNPVLKVDRYPLPRVEELFANLSGGELFSKIDLSQAYNQICLTEESKMLTVINTHRGLFKYNRLVYGLASSSGIFCRISESIVKDIPNAQSFCDDILIYGKTRESHLATLEAVLHKLKDLGLKVKRSKCTFLANEVCYLGFIVSKDGIKPDPSKVSAISNMPPPSNVSEVRSFLGMINFYSKFIPNVSEILHPLHCLLKKGKCWDWNPACAAAFKKIKNCMLGRRILAHYDPSNNLTLTCDASAHGVAGVLTQPDRRGQERPIAYVSRKLNAAERNYSQIHREALAIVFCAQKFHQYLFGRRFTLKTDHKPLVSIFGPYTGIPSMTSSRMQRWALLLMAYDFNIQYVNTVDNRADALSRLPMGECKESESPEQSYLHFASDALLLDSNEIRRMSARDTLLGRVINYINSGWPEKAEIKDLQPYFNRRNELYLELGCVMWGHRVVVPEACRGRVLHELHEPHMGIVKTKAIARSYVWWPGLDEAIEAHCRACDSCAAVAPAPLASASIPWHWPSRPYERIHLDFLGPIDGRTYLVSIDATSKWIEVWLMVRTSAEAVVSKLQEAWSRWGIPKQIVSDNGPPFSSKEFNDFLEINGVRHMYSAPYHPSSNGAAESAVKSIKNVIKKAKHERVNADRAILKFLLYYHNTPHSTTGESPARILQGRDLRLRLDILKPSRNAKVVAEQSKIVERSKKPARELGVGQSVQYRNYRPGAKWVDGIVIDKLGKSDYTVADNDGLTHHRHIDQMRRRLRNSIVYPNPSSVTGPEDAATVDRAVDSNIAADETACTGTPPPPAPVPSQATPPRTAIDSAPAPRVGGEHEHPLAPPKRPAKPEPPLPSLGKRVPKPVKRYGFDFD